MKFALNAPSRRTFHVPPLTMALLGQCDGMKARHNLAMENDMATMDTPMNERRHMPDRRTSAAGMGGGMAGAMNMGSRSGAGGMHTTTARTGETRDGSHADSHTGAKRMSAMDWIPMLLLMIGGLNWGLVGLFDFNLVATLFGESSPLSRIIYVAVGLSALYSLYLCARMSSDKH
jgi:uncharacterized membrane protein YuzA (DUF378 family)